jgi:hypothetical protein
VTFFFCPSVCLCLCALRARLACVGLLFLRACLFNPVFLCSCETLIAESCQLIWTSCFSSQFLICFFSGVFGSFIWSSSCSHLSIYFFGTAPLKSAAASSSSREYELQGTEHSPPTSAASGAALVTPKKQRQTTQLDGFYASPRKSAKKPASLNSGGLWLLVSFVFVWICNFICV